jgi:hypothetical protein
LSGGEESRSVQAMDPETAIAAFFAAMNRHDADTAASLVVPDVEIVLGPHALTGRQAVRELAVQEDAELVFETVPVSFAADGDHVDVTARRLQRWRQTGEVAVDEELQARFTLDSEGLIVRVELS